MLKKSNKSWYLITGWYRKGNWPTKVESNILSASELKAREIMLTEVVDEDESFQIYTVTRMGSTEEYINKYGLDGQLDLLGPWPI